MEKITKSHFFRLFRADFYLKVAFSHGCIGDVLDEYLEVELMRESNKFQKVPRPTLEEEFNKNRKNHKKDIFGIYRGYI